MLYLALDIVCLLIRPFVAQIVPADWVTHSAHACCCSLIFSRMRQFCFRLVRYQSFETISYTVILLSSVLLALEIPIGVDPDLQSQLCSFQVRPYMFNCVLKLTFVCQYIRVCFLSGIHSLTCGSTCIIPI